MRKAETAFKYNVNSLFDLLKSYVANSKSKLVSDSRRVLPGDVFVFIGDQNRCNVLDYIDDAINNGASVVLIDNDIKSLINLKKNIEYVVVVDLKEIIGSLAAKWYGYLSEKITIIAVTGTNGKTTCVQWIANSLNNSGKKCGTIGTMGAIIPNGDVIYRGLTTPDVITMHWIVSEMYLNGVQFIAIEASSIGIEQGRLNGLIIKIACFTNLTRDHLDYHLNIDNYEKSKSKLFNLSSVEKVIINIDDNAGKRLVENNKSGVQFVFSVNPNVNADIFAYDIDQNANGYNFKLCILGHKFELEINCLGFYNIYNVLLVVSVLKALDIRSLEIIKLIKLLKGVKGRLEKVLPFIKNKEINYPYVIVDYAHTPDALSKILSSLRDLAIIRKGKLICVFGCGGNRDVGKRSEMTLISIKLADKIIITSDNPRNEDPYHIVSQMLEKIDNDSMASIDVIINRSNAIMHAIWQSNINDIVVIAGKGHETYQEFNNKKIFFDDYQWASLAMSLPYVSGVSIDTRTLNKGDIFFALKGANFDGHNYLDSAYLKGACAAVVSNNCLKSIIPQVIVNDTKNALNDVAFSWRRKYNPSVISVVGSNGKTTTKEMISVILTSFFGKSFCLSTKGNLNNDIGVPLSILRLRKEHKVAVFELGMNHPGEIKHLSELVKPNIIVITNAQREHQEFMKDVESVAYENGSIINFVSEDGVIIYPGDDSYSHIWEDLSKNKKVFLFGFTKRCNLYAKDILSFIDKTTCTLVYLGIEVKLVLNVPGLHNLRNALAAISAALALGVPLLKAVSYISSFHSIKGRMYFNYLDKDRILIDDTYNSNPDSALAAIDVLKNLPKPQVLVFGEMGEIGINGDAMHYEIAKYAYDCGIDILVTIGKFSSVMAKCFEGRCFICKNIDEIIMLIHKMSGPASILIKGSRFMKMERIVSYFDTYNKE
ncbi:bifunctional UDP-N-acetylmuramoylalanyl-D-glutamate--2,6-diaminopimelate ligase/UDP-N-acetylmuramyl pentapeptide synthase MurE/MurF [Candidatus Kinetoplastibacterium desouzaii TCC079E]|uniref:Multifunctional fusion protein n=1 Tax=Candidatus Kinetoplastidibacterium desouzai TCC079E TaxID=1208919 RepID=M1LV16_9PROT|nr:UDP-N-acetylmuramoyl-L-alanyl-D-glutamate--2,6-diaminopimelate ligase [Candidatus Kinetoplastibacterium desouzaii]AGF47124.1 bifunctional UDP-N-acetylmuramoylalanyl-D-glutamate--2,6-diaminopimelate ligase/UDP-N-acetylmuramyl pentapeptide synthase MurE/MurF [Candidatus Kinetoplastibacterium desouzaii TCC079E]